LLVFSPDTLGSVSYQSGLGILWFSIVNIHHFVLDGAIWKLRDGAVARILLRAEKGDEAPVEAAGPAGRWIRPVIWSVAAACAAVAFFGAYEFEFGYRRPMEIQDLHRVALGAERLGWIGRGNEGIYDNLASSLSKKIQRNQAPASSWKRVEAYYRRSLELGATARAWSGLATAYLEQEQVSEALACIDSALALDAEHLGSLLTLAEIRMRTEDFAAADEAIQRAFAIQPDSSRARRIAETLAARKAGKLLREANRPTAYTTSDPTQGSVP
jgi:tetratricopeptide (TPR) repeat protein